MTFLLLLFYLSIYLLICCLVAPITEGQETMGRSEIVKHTHYRICPIAQETHQHLSKHATLSLGNTAMTARPHRASPGQIALGSFFLHRVFTARKEDVHVPAGGCTQLVTKTSQMSQDTHQKCPKKFPGASGATSTAKLGPRYAKLGPTLGPS